MNKRVNKKIILSMFLLMCTQLSLWGWRFPQVQQDRVESARIEMDKLNKQKASSKNVVKNAREKFAAGLKKIGMTMQQWDKHKKLLLASTKLEKAKKMFFAELEKMGMTKEKWGEKWGKLQKERKQVVAAYRELEAAQKRLNELKKVEIAL